MANTPNMGDVAQPVDAELPAAVALSDTLANPTAPAVGAYLLGKAGVFGSTWQRAEVFATADGSGVTELALLVQSWGALFNGTSWDRQRANLAASYLASAARTATPAVSDITTYNLHGIRVFINVTAIADTPSVVFTVEAKDSVGAGYAVLLTSAAIVGAGLTTLIVMPGITVAANVAAAMGLARTLRILPTHGDADSITYSVSYDLLS